MTEPRMIHYGDVKCEKCGNLTYGGIGARCSHCAGLLVPVDSTINITREILCKVIDIMKAADGAHPTYEESFEDALTQILKWEESTH